jgi:hypothetical protein
VLNQPGQLVLAEVFEQEELPQVVGRHARHDLHDLSR